MLKNLLQYASDLFDRLGPGGLLRFGFGFAFLGCIPLALSLGFEEKLEQAGFVSVIGLISAFIATRLLRDAGHRIHVVSWDGYEHETIYKSMKLGRSVQFLTYARPLDVLPRLTLRNCIDADFEVLVADAELLHRYYLLDLIEPSNALENDLLVLRTYNLLHPKTAEHSGTFLQQTLGKLLYSGESLLGVPVRFGFQEILLRKQLLDTTLSDLKAKAEGYQLGYSDIDLRELLDKGITIGLWHWHLPSLIALLLTTSHAKTLSTIEERYEFLVNATSADLTEIATLLAEYARREKLIMFDLRSWRRRSGECDIVLGAGSWALWEGEIENTFRLCVPNDAVIVWTDCATRLRHEDREGVTGAGLNFIRHLYSLAAQSSISEKKTDTYRALPVTEEAITALRQGIDSERPALTTLKFITEGIATSSGQRIMPSMPRPHPKHWTQWISVWDEIEQLLAGK